MGEDNSSLALLQGGALGPAQDPSILWRTQEKLDLIKRTVADGATNDELELFFHQARRSGLDPLAKQIYYIKRKGKGTIQVGIDGLRLIADRTGCYAGSDDAEFDGTEGKYPGKATITVYKMVQGVRCAFTATARWSEYYPGDDQGFQWRKMPFAMLAKCAEALALRKGFPAEMSGLYIHEEMDQAHDDVVVTQSEPKAAPRTARSNATEEIPPHGEPHGKSAFGHIPAKWPLAAQFSKSYTENQETQIGKSAGPRDMPDDHIPLFWKAVAKAYGVEWNTSAGASLFIDWLIKADDSCLGNAWETIQEEQRATPIDAEIVPDLDYRQSFLDLHPVLRWPTFADDEMACRVVYTQVLGHAVTWEKEVTDADWATLYAWAQKVMSNPDMEPAQFKKWGMAQTLTGGR